MLGVSIYIYVYRLYRDNGKENGNYYSGFRVYSLGCIGLRVLGFKVWPRDKDFGGLRFEDMDLKIEGVRCRIFSAFRAPKP